jgi:hypothetical protein
MNLLKIPVFLFAAIIFFSCNSNSTNPIIPDPQFSRFPLTTGLTWHYKSEAFRFNPRPITMSISLDTFRASGKNYITGDTVINGLTAKVIKGERYQDNITLVAHRYYLDTDTALLRIAYSNSGIFSFGPDSFNNEEEPKYFYKFNNKTYNSIRDLIYNNFENDFSSGNLGDITIEDPPAVLFKYPVINNEEWLYKNAGYGLLIYRKYIGYETIFTPGLFSSCIKVQRIIPNFGNELILYDYYSERGPVKRDYQFKDIEVINEFGQEIGLIDAKEIHILTGY